MIESSVNNFIIAIITLFIFSKSFLNCTAFKNLQHLQYEYSKIKVASINKLTKTPYAQSKDSDWIDTFSQRSKVSIDYFSEG